MKALVPIQTGQFKKPNSKGFLKIGKRIGVNASFFLDTNMMAANLTTQVLKYGTKNDYVTLKTTHQCTLGDSRH